MPRRRQHRPDPEPNPPQPASPSPEPSDPSSGDDDPSPLAFYNTTFSAHRVSPLYLGSTSSSSSSANDEALTPARLQILSQRLRDRLVGDVVRGVEVGLGPDAGEAGLGRAGALEGVEMRWVGMRELLGGLESEDDDDMRDLRALWIELRYELAARTALLLPPVGGDGEERRGVGGEQTRFSVGVAGEGMDVDVDATADPGHFLALPLLLMRMPAPLKAVVAEFLSTTFDCRVSAMRLGTRSLVGSWEAWITSAGLPSRGPLAKDVVLSLGFHLPPPDRAAAASDQTAGEEEATAAVDQPLGIKSVDVIVPATELRKFVAAGKRLETKTWGKRTALTEWGWEDDLRKRRRLAGRLYEEGWEWRTASKDGHGHEPGHQPFTEAFACYLKEHLGLNLFHPGVRVIKIACGGFVMSETRLKMFAPAGSEESEDMVGQRSAVWELLGRLAEKAQIQTVGK